MLINYTTLYCVLFLEEEKHSVCGDGLGWVESGSSPLTHCWQEGRGYKHYILYRYLVGLTLRHPTPSHWLIEAVKVSLSNDLPTGSVHHEDETGTKWLVPFRDYPYRSCDQNINEDLNRVSFGVKTENSP